MYGERLRARLGTRGERLDARALDAALAVLIERAETRLPHRPITREAFVDRIADALGETIELAAIERIAAADLYLAAALAAHDEPALALAEAELVPAARQAAGKIDGNAAFVDEVAQRVRDRLFVGKDGEAGIAGYRGSGPLSRWVRVVATRIAVDLKRAGARHDDADAIEEMPAPDDPELAVVWRDSADAYKRALTSAFEALDRRERTLMRQRYIDGLDINALGRIHRVHPSTAFRWVQQIEHKLAAATRKALVAKLALSESQLHSMERLIASQLTISMPRLLRTKD